MTRHYHTQLSRLRRTPLSPHAVNNLVQRMLPRASKFDSCAVLLMRCHTFYGTSTLSNGDTLWCIYRDGVPVTIFFRRSTQGYDPLDFAVQVVMM